MPEISVTSDEITTVLEDIDPDLAAVLGPAIINDVTEGVATEVNEDVIIHDIKGGENFDLMAAVHQAVDIATVIKITLEIIKLTKNISKDDLIKSVKSHPNVQRKNQNGQIDKILEDMANLIKRQYS